MQHFLFENRFVHFKTKSYLYRGRRTQGFWRWWVTFLQSLKWRFWWRLSKISQCGSKSVNWMLRYLKSIDHFCHLVLFCVLHSKQFAVKSFFFFSLKCILLGSELHEYVRTSPFSQGNVQLNLQMLKKLGFSRFLYRYIWNRTEFPRGIIVLNTQLQHCLCTFDILSYLSQTQNFVFNCEVESSEMFIQPKSKRGFVHLYLSHSSMNVPNSQTKVVDSRDSMDVLAAFLINVFHTKPWFSVLYTFCVLKIKQGSVRCATLEIINLYPHPALNLPTFSYSTFWS